MLVISYTNASALRASYYKESRTPISTWQHGATAMMSDSCLMPHQIAWSVATPQPCRAKTALGLLRFCSLSSSFLSTVWTCSPPLSSNICVPQMLLSVKFVSACCSNDAVNRALRSRLSSMVACSYWSMWGKPRANALFRQFCWTKANVNFRQKKPASSYLIYGTVWDLDKFFIGIYTKNCYPVMTPVILEAVRKDNC